MSAQKESTLDDVEIDYRIIPSRTAKKLRVRVGIDGVSVIRPKGRQHDEVEAFVEQHLDWIKGQLKRINDFRSIRVPRRSQDRLLFRGKETEVRLIAESNKHGPNIVNWEGSTIVVRKSNSSQTPVAKSLENWLRRQAKERFQAEMQVVLPKLKREPNRVLVMGQRTKWGNCSSKKNISLNWRLILAPDYVLRYIVIHEATHLAVPDHSQKFWLTVKSLCPDTERAKQWLCRNVEKLRIDLNCLFSS